MVDVFKLKIGLRFFVVVVLRRGENTGRGLGDGSVSGWLVGSGLFSVIVGLVGLCVGPEPFSERSYFCFERLMEMERGKSSLIAHWVVLSESREFQAFSLDA